MKYAIFDIGTKATRILIGDVEKLREGFKWENFKNFGDRTYLGDYLSSDGFIYLKGVKRTIDKIIEFKKKAEREGVDKYYAVGTAIFRLSNNGQEVCDLIKNHTNIEINILSKEDEAKYSLIAAMLTGKDYLSKNDIAVLIDQGGGSTEISFGEFDEENQIKFLGLQSLDLGTVILKNKLFTFGEKFDYEVTFENVLVELIEEARKIIKNHIKFDYKNRSLRLFGIGSGITNITTMIDKRKRTNKQQHGTILKSDIIQKIAEQIAYDDRYLYWEWLPNANDKYPDGKRRTIRSLNELYKKNSDLIDRPFSILFGRIAYKEILDFYRVPEIRVCGAGLRYGVFFSKVFEGL